MNLQKLIFTGNACYKAGRTITVKGIMVHSTGANNPNLCRYVGPDDGLLGKNQYGNHWNQDTPDQRQVCVHGFIGKLNQGYLDRHRKARQREDELTAAKRERIGKSKMLDGFIREIESRPLVIEEFDDRLWAAVIDRVMVATDGTMTFHFKNGAEIYT